jgi:integrase
MDKKIAPEFGDLPLAALSQSKKQCRGEFKEWRDRLAARSRRQADYAWTVLARILAVALDRGWVDTNPCERGGRLYSGNRRDKIWTIDDELAFLERAPQHLHLPLTLALGTGQREGDLLKLTWSPTTALISGFGNPKPAPVSRLRSARRLRQCSMLRRRGVRLSCLAPITSRGLKMASAPHGERLAIRRLALSASPSMTSAAWR